MNTLHTTQFLENKIALLEERWALFSHLVTGLASNNASLKNLFDIIPVPFFYKDGDGIYLQCNDKFAESIFGVKRQEVEGKSVFDFKDDILDGSIEFFHQQDLKLWEACAQGRQRYEKLVQCADGINRYYVFYKSAFVLDNGKRGMFGIMLDISKYKYAQKELDQINTVLKQCISDPDHTGD